MSLIRDEFDKILVFIILMMSMALYFYKTSEITAGWVGTVIGVIATLLTQKVSQAVRAAADVAKGTNGSDRSGQVK